MLYRGSVLTKDRTTQSILILLLTLQRLWWCGTVIDPCGVALLSRSQRLPLHIFCVADGTMSLFLIPVEMQLMHLNKNTMGIRLKLKVFKIQKTLMRQRSSRIFVDN